MVEDTTAPEDVRALLLAQIVQMREERLRAQNGERILQGSPADSVTL